MHRSPAVAALVLGLSLTSTACGSGDDAPSSTTATVSGTEHNQADVTFATRMIQHHAQALAMVDLTVGRELDPEVAALADEIRQSQAPEIETMSDWLEEWGEEIPETVRDHANAHGGHGEDTSGDTGTGMAGMMSEDDMTALEDAGADFEDMWLEMMVEHHQGAVDMARAEEAEGRFGAAVELAQEIQSSQSAEIKTMQDLLG